MHVERKYIMNNELFNKINSAFKDNNTFLSDSLDLKDNEKEILYNDVGFILRKAYADKGHGVDKQFERLVVSAFVELTKEWETSEEDSWSEFVLKRLVGSDITTFGVIYNKVCECVKSLNAQNKFFVFNCFTKKYYTSILSHSFSPKSSVFSFFDLCWSIYCIDLCQQYKKDVQTLLIITRVLRNKLSTFKSSIDESITIGSKAYNLRAGIQGLILDEDKENIFIQLLDTTFSCIDCLSNNIPMKFNTYSKKLLHQWWIEKEHSFGNNKDRNRAKRSYDVASDYSKISTKYILDSGKVKLSISSFILTENAEEEPIVQIKKGDIVLKEESIPTFGSGILATTKQREYDLDSLSLDSLNDLGVYIYHKSNCIYSSKISRKGDFIIFNNDKEVNSQVLIPGIYFIYAPNFSELKKRPSGIKRITKKLYSFDANEGEVIGNSDRFVFFRNEKTDNSIFPAYNEMQGVIYRTNEKEYKVIEGDIFINVAKNYNYFNLGINCNNKKYKLADFTYNESDDLKCFNISSIANDGEPLNIVIFRYSDNYILKELNLLKFNNISILFDKDIYYGNDSSGVVKFKTDKFEKEKIFNILDEDYFIKYQYGEISFNPPILRWRFDNDMWNNKPSLPLYYNQISNSSILEIDAPSEMNFDIFIISSNRTIPMPNDNMKFKVGQMIHSLAASNNSDKSVQIVIKFQNKNLEIAKIYLKQCFLSSPFNVISEKYLVEWNSSDFIGEKSSILKLQILNSDNRCVFTNELDKENNVIFDLNSLNLIDGYYSFVVNMIKKGLITREEVIFKEKYLLGDIKKVRFKGKTIKIKGVMIFNDQKVKDLVKPIYLSDLKYLKTIDGADIYSGKLFDYDNYGNRRYIDYLKEKRINPMRIELKTLKQCYLGYGLDDSDPDLVEYDGEFSMSSNGQLKAPNVRNSNYFEIDYYLFDIV